MLYLYHVSQSENKGYDTYSDFVCVASSEDEARNTYPNDWTDLDYAWQSGYWASSPSNVSVKLIGVANPDIEPGIICSSFHAG